jgi:hypothetical protein
MIIVLLKISLAASYKSNIHLTSNPGIPPLDIYSSKIRIYSHTKILHGNAYGIFVITKT